MVPSITVTPPTHAPVPSAPVPAQKLGRAQLYVPINTEDIGWEPAGLFWAGRYAYPVRGIYAGGEHNERIGSYRGGPVGYRFETYDAPPPAQLAASGPSASTFAEPAPQPPTCVSALPTTSFDECVDDAEIDCDSDADSDSDSGLSTFSLASTRRRSSNSSVSTVASDSDMDSGSLSSSSIHASVDAKLLSSTEDEHRGRRPLSSTSSAPAFLCAKQHRTNNTPAGAPLRPIDSTNTASTTTTAAAC